MDAYPSPYSDGKRNINTPRIKPPVKTLTEVLFMDEILDSTNKVVLVK
jgi:hypothetical protein